MGPKDESSAKPAEIGNALVEALGFEPADGTKLGRSAVAEVSDQISEVGFSVSDAFEGDDVVVTDDSDGSGKGASAGRNGSKRSVDDGHDADGAVDLGADGAALDLDDDQRDELGWSTDADASSVNGSPVHDVTAPLHGVQDAGAAVGESTDGLKAEADAKLKQIVEGDPNDTVVMPGPPDEEIAAAGASAGSIVKDKDDLVESLVAAGTMADVAVPTSPPIADPRAAPEGDGPAVVEVDAKADPEIPTGPAVTGEYPVVEVQPQVAERPAVVDARSVIDRPRSVSDMFSGGITGRRRLQARKVRRVVRHIDPWSVLTFSVLFHLCLFAALLLASVLVWNVAEEAGTIENVENFIRELGDYETFEIDGEAIFRAAVAIAGIMTLAASVLVVLLTVMFNLLSDLLGGVRITVIEEETVRVKPKKGE
jgi:hypothetical protein